MAEFERTLQDKIAGMLDTLAEGEDSDSQLKGWGGREGSGWRRKCDGKRGGEVMNGRRAQVVPGGESGSEDDCPSVSQSDKSASL